MAVLYALFDAEGSADAVARELARNCDAHPSYAVQLHREQPLDGNSLPESATDTGRNTLMAAGVGGLVMAVLGGIAGGVLDVPGLDAFSGTGVGAVTGVLVGVLSGMMSGTRRPKPVLAELARRLGDGTVLLTVEVDERRVEIVEEILEASAGEEIGRC